MGLFEWLREYQTLTVGILGFIGVISTIWFTASSARRQREEERSHESQSVRVALLEELKIFEVTAATGQHILDNPEKGAPLNFSTYYPDDFYRAFIGRIGLLSQQEVRRVVFAYLMMESYKRGINLHGRPIRESDTFISVPLERAAEFSDLLRDTRRSLKDAICVLERAIRSGSRDE